MQKLTLYELNSLVSATVEDAFPSSLWVEAELMEVREVKGHCYMELVQKDLYGATPVARASAKCWSRTWNQLKPRFFEATGVVLRPGMQLLLSVSVEFHPTYGYALIVNDIDPTYTLGDMARKRQEIIKQLKAEGVYDLQRQLPLPLFCQRVAVISSATAAGYGDFSHQLMDNDFGFFFSVELFRAVMQGEQIEQSIIAALDLIAMRESEFDCVVIIRGGGATADMSGFDSLMLAENIANFPLPIITGIGHDRDECVLDMISHKALKTPTAVAAFLVDNLADIEVRLDDAGRRIMSFTALFSTRMSARLDNIFLQLQSSASRLLIQHKHRLELLEQKIESLDPKRLLSRGYSMTLLNGRLITDASQLSVGDEVETVFEKSKIKSIVK